MFVSETCRLRLLEESDANELYALIDHALGVWELNRVEVRVAPENTRSRAIPERLGFREEGTLRQAERIQGCFLDSVVYGMLASEWVSLRGGRKKILWRRYLKRREGV